MSANIKEWNVEDETFWESTAKRVAYRNLWISVPALLCGFAIWLMWGIITVQMHNLGFPFTKDELFTLTAISGLAGATMRIPSSFFIRLQAGATQSSSPPRCCFLRPSAPALPCSIRNGRCGCSS